MDVHVVRLERSIRVVERPLPGAEQLLDVAALRVAELEPRDEPPRLRGIVVLDRSLEMLAERRRLLQLSPQPPEQAYLRGFHRANCRRAAVSPMGGDGLEPPTLCV